MKSVRKWDYRELFNNMLYTNTHKQHDHTGESIITQVHITPEQVATFEITPPHAPRVETEIYKKAHTYLVYTQDTPCLVCGVSHSTLHDPQKNRYGSKALETHHYPIERSLMNACDIAKVHKRFPQVIDTQTFEAFIDSAANLVVLCDVHHRSMEQGIHHLLVQDFMVLPFLKDHYQVVATAQDKDKAVQIDMQIEVPGD